jgi:hypothetical protein
MALSTVHVQRKEVMPLSNPSRWPRSTVHPQLQPYNRRLIVAERRNIMFRAKQSLVFAGRNIALILLGMLIAALAQSAMTPVATAHNTQDELNASGSTSQASVASTWVSCVPVGIVTYAVRVHVQCQTAISGVSYFAASTADAANVARVLSVISAAQVAGRTLAVLYDPADTSGAAIGCQAADCRLIQAVGFGQ